MIPHHHYQKRRSELLGSLRRPLLLLAGGLKSRNYPQNPYPYRADSSFLFLFPNPEPESAALFDPADRSVTLFLTERTPERALWHGADVSFEEMKQRLGVTQVLTREKLKDHVRSLARGRAVDALAVADANATVLAAEISGQRLDSLDADAQGEPSVIDAIARLRLAKSTEEAAEMRATAAVTREAHGLAMAHTKPGVKEDMLAGLVEGCFLRHGCVPAYGTILTVRGEILHNVHHPNLVQEGDLVLLDAGAESSSGYCSDVTRTWPATGRFGVEAREIYDIVLRAQKDCIALVKPGMRYRDVHVRASDVIAAGLKDLGLLRGNLSTILESGAHAVFFPHGIGHLLGLDVHDMEAYGDRVSYAKGRTRSKQFGTAYLRMDLDLQPGIAVTIEPGIYFVPALIHGAEFREKFRDLVDFARAEKFLQMNEGRGFGGIRIEDDVLTTESGHEVLTASIPKEVAEVEAAVGSAVR